jgi:hypothetical protein
MKRQNTLKSKSIYDRTSEEKYLFHDYNTEEYKIKAVRNQSRFFERLRKKIAEKTKDNYHVRNFHRKQIFSKIRNIKNWNQLFYKQKEIPYDTL